jgi:hypothetical protein
MTEHEIAQIIIDHREQLGYRDSLVLQETELLNGYIDLMFLPTSNGSSQKLVLVEVENERDPADAIHALGQVFKYYASSLAITEQGFKILRSVVEKHSDLFRSTSKKSRRMAMGVERQRGIKNQGVARQLLTDGEPLDPKSIAMFLAFPDMPKNVEHKLRPVILSLRERHHLDVGVLVANVTGLNVLWR